MNESTTNAENEVNINELLSFSTLEENDYDESLTREKLDKESSKLFSEKVQGFWRYLD